MCPPPPAACGVQAVLTSNPYLVHERQKTKRGVSFDLHIAGGSEGLARTKVVAVIALVKAYLFHGGNQSFVVDFVHYATASEVAPDCGLFGDNQYSPLHPLMDGYSFCHAIPLVA